MQLLLLAFEAALYPTLLAAVVIIMTLDRPLKLLASYLAGGLTISVGLGCVIVFALDGSGAVDNSRSGLSWTADLAVGGLVLLLAVALAVRADERLRRRLPRKGSSTSAEPAEPKGEPWSERLLSRGSAPIVFFAAMAINVPGAAYLIGLKDIAAGHHSTGVAVAQILLFNAIMFLLAEIPLAGLLLAPERTMGLVKRADAWVSAHSRQIAIGVCLTMGVFLIIRGIAHAG